MFRSNVRPEELPDGWIASQLKEFCDIRAGGRLGLNKSHYQPSGVEAFSAAGQDGFVSETEGEASSIILASIGSCGRSYMTNGPWTSLANTQIITPNLAVADQRYLHALLDNPAYWSLSGSAQPFIKPSDVKGAWVPIPPLDEQRRIAEVLRSVDEALFAQQCVIERMRVSLDAMCHELLPDPTTTELPPLWKKTTLGDFSRVATGKTPSTKRTEFWAGDIPFVTPTDLTDSMDVGLAARHLTDAGAKQSKITPKNSVLYTCIASVGKMGLAREAVAFNQQINACACNDEPDAEFLFWALYRMTQSIKERCGTTAVPIINKSSFSSLPLFIPERELRAQISSALTEMAQQIDEEQKVARGTLRVKGELMSDLLTGRVRVPA